MSHLNEAINCRNTERSKILRLAWYQFEFMLHGFRNNTKYVNSCTHIFAVCLWLWMKSRLDNCRYNYMSVKSSFLNVWKAAKKEKRKNEKKEIELNVHFLFCISLQFNCKKMSFFFSCLLSKHIHNGRRFFARLNLQVV